MNRDNLIIFEMFFFFYHIDFSMIYNIILIKKNEKKKYNSIYIYIYIFFK